MRSSAGTLHLSFLAAVLAATTVVAPAASEPARSGDRYINQRYGFSLSVPPETFAPAGARNTDKGAAWESRDGRARLLAVATENAGGDTLQSYRQFLIRDLYKNAVIDYAPVRDTWFVLSGRMDGVMFYERIMFACDGRYIYGWQLNYPVAERSVYDRIVEAIHRSYRPGRGEDGRCGRG